MENTSKKKITYRTLCFLEIFTVEKVAFKGS